LHSRAEFIFSRGAALTPPQAHDATQTPI